MNQFFYRVIFSKTLHRKVVVSEIARSGGKVKSESCAVRRLSDNRGLESPDFDGKEANTQWLTVRCLSCSSVLKFLKYPSFISTLLTFSPFKLKALMIGLSSFWGISPAIAQALQIHADASAPRHQQAIILEAANGVPLVNIQTPNAQGVSHNKYQQFDVDTQGAILNNSRRRVQTELGGWVQGNPYMAGGTARTIINEVNTSRPSQLRGYLEVAGDKADVIVANPSGIHCTGCGVLNAGRGTLTTGEVLMDQGRVIGYHVDRGGVVVAGRGLDSSRQDYTDILAKETQLNAGVWANKLSVVTGNNTILVKATSSDDSKTTGTHGDEGHDVYRIDDSHLQIIRVPRDNAPSTPAYAVDVAELGGMYAGSIHLVGTEEGLGVRNAGHIGASTGGVRLTTNGQVLNTGYIGAQAGVNAQAKDTIQHISSGIIQTKNGAIRLVSQQNIVQDGSLIAQGGATSRTGHITLHARENLTQTGGSFAQGDIDYRAKQVRASEQTRTVSGVMFEQSSGQIKGLASLTSLGAKTTIQGDESVQLHGQHFAQGELKVLGNHLNLDKAILSAYDVGVIAHQSDLPINQAQVYANNLAQWSTPGELSTKHSQLRAKEHQVWAHQLDNTQGVWQHTGQTDWKLDLKGGLSNTKGVMQSEGTLSVQTSTLNNRQGIVDVAGALRIDTQYGQVNNQAGILSAEQALQIESGRIENTQGLVQSGQAIAIDTHGQAFINEKTLAIEGTQGVVSFGTLSLHTPDLKNAQGYIGAKERATLHIAQTLDNQEGEVIGAQTLRLQGQVLNVDNRLGKLYSGQQLHLEATRLSGDGDIQSGGDLNLHVQTDFTAHTDIKAKHHLTFSTTGKIVNLAQWSAENTLDVKADRIDNTATGVFNAHHTKLVAENTVVNRGLINSATTQKEHISGDRGNRSDFSSLTLIKAKHIENIGTGRIYGDHVAFEGETLRNTDEKASSHHTDSPQDVTVNAAVIAARQRLDIGVKESENYTRIAVSNQKGGASIYSGEDIYFGQRLDGHYHAIGQAKTLANRSATIEVLGNIELGVDKVRNTNEYFKTEIQLDSVDTTPFHYLRPEGTNKLIDWGLLKWIPYSRAGRVTWKDNSTPMQLPKNNDFANNPLPIPNTEVCANLQERIGCEVVPDSLYPSQSPVWAFFNIAAPDEKPADFLDYSEELFDIEEPEELVKQAWEDEQSFAQRVEDYPQAMQAYEQKKAKYEALPETHRRWVEASAKQYELLNQAIVAHNARFNMGEVYTDFWNVNVHKTEVRKDKIIQSKPGQILAGGEIILNGESFINDKSTVIAGGHIAGRSAVENIDGKGIQITTRFGDQQWTYSKWRGGFRRYHQRKWGGWQPFEASVVESITVPVVEYRQHTDYRQKTTDLATRPEQLSTAVHTVMPIVHNNAHWEVRSIAVDTRLPSSSLYRVNPAVDNHVVIETDPAFADWRTWLSSDYMYDALRHEHPRVHKRLGDGYYEQGLVREQIHQLTGRQFLAGFENTQAQYKALMDNGITFAHRFNLSPGVALSEAMVTQLTSDIVWLEERTATLPNGETTQVLVPQVYVVTRPGDLDGQGALLSGKTVQLKGSSLSNSGTIAGRELVQLNQQTIKNLQGRIQGALVSLQGNRVENIGGVIEAEEGLAIQANQALRHESTTTQSENQGEGFEREATHLDRKALIRLRGDGEMRIQAQDMTLKGAAIQHEGQGNLLLQARDTLALKALQTGYHERIGIGNHRRAAQEHTAQVSVVSGQGNVQLSAKDIHSEGATLSAHQVLSLLAENQIALEGANNTQSVSEYHRYNSGTAATRKTKTIQREQSQSIQKGSALSAEQIALQGHTIEMKGGQIIADKALMLIAKDDLTIQADKNTYRDVYQKKVKRSGVLTGGSVGVTFGAQQEKHHYDEKAVTQSDARATVGSLTGDVMLIAGHHAQIVGTDLIASGDKAIHLHAQSAAIEAGKDILNRQESHEFKQSGLTISFSSAVTDMAVKAKDSLGRAQQVQDSRLKALHQVKAAQEGVMMAQELSQAMGQSNASGGTQQARDVKVSVSIGSQQSRHRSQSEAVSHQASLVQAGQLNLRTTEGDMAILGSQLLGQDIQLSSAGNLHLLSVQDTSTHRSETKNSAWSGGVFVGYSGGSYGFGVEGSGQLGKGHEKSERVEQVNTLVQGDKVSLRSGADTQLKGGQVKGTHIVADIGKNLLIESRQDSQHYDSQYAQAGVSGSYAIYGSGSNTSVNASLNKGKLAYAQVEAQSGLWAGQDGVQLNVEGNTHLKGGVIASQAAAQKNQLSTGTLTHENIHNHSEVQVQSVSGGFSTDNSQNMAHAVSATMSALGNIHQSDRSTTYSAIGANIPLNIKDSTDPALTLSRDTERANQKVERFDIETLRERQEMAQVIGEIANNTIQMSLKPRLDKAEQDKQAAESLLAIDPQNTQALAQLAQANQTIAQYGQGSDIQLAMRAVTGVLQGVATGSAAQAVVGGLSPYANQLIKEATTDPMTRSVNKTANLMAHAVLGAIEAYSTGNHVVSGATGAVSSELMGQLITEQLYQTTPDQLTQAQQQTVSALSQMASGLAGVAVGDGTASAITSAQVGKRAVENNLLTQAEYKRRGELLDILDSREGKNFTSMEAQEMLQYVQTAAYGNRLLAQYQKDPTSLKPDERAYLAQRIYEVAGGDIEKIERIIQTPANQQLDDGRVAKASEQARRKVGLDNSMQMQLARSVSDGMSVLGASSLTTLKEIPVLMRMLSNPVVVNTTGSVVANASVQLYLSDKMNYVELVGVGATGALTARMMGSQAVVATTGMAAATSIANKGDIKQDTSLAVMGKVVGDSFSHPIMKLYAPEVIQKTPYLIEKIRNNVVEEKK